MSINHKSKGYAVSALALAIASSGLYSSVSSANMLEEIVVTARKKSESLQDVPVVVSAFSSEMIERYNLNNLEDVADFTPGLIVGEGNLASGNSIVLRGVGTAQVSSASDQAVSFAVDNFSIGHGAFSRVSQLDIVQVEVLKGPQALFFGKNSPGGVISYTTADPSDEFESGLSTGYETGSGDRYVQALVSGPVSETLGARFVVRQSDNKGWLENDAVATGNPDTGLPDFLEPIVGLTADGASSSTLPSGTELFLRGTVVWDPADAFHMRTKMTYNEVDSNYNVFSVSQPVGCASGVSQPVVLDGLPPFQLSSGPCKADDKSSVHQMSQAQADVLHRTGGKTGDRADMELYLLTNEFEYELSDDFTLTSVSGWFQSTELLLGSIDLGQIANFRAASTYFQQDHYSQEFRLSSNFDGPVNFTAGTLYGEAEQTNETVAVFGSALVVGPSSQPKTIKTRTRSVFAQAEWEINDVLTMEAGARWTKEEKDFQAKEAGQLVTNLVTDNRKFIDLSPEVTLTWRPQDNITLFAAYKEGFKSGGFNTTLLVGGGFNVQRDLLNPGFLYEVSYEPETVKGFEIGAKTEWLDNRLRINAAIFDYEYTDLQLGQHDAEIAALVVVNAGQLDTRGLEIDALYLPEIMEGLSLRGAIAYLDSKFVDYNAPCYGGQAIELGCNLNFDATASVPHYTSQDFDGRTPVSAPELTGSFGATYEFPVMDGWSLTVSADAIYSDSYFTQQEQSPLSEQDAYWKYNASVALRSDDDAWAVSLTGRNLTDEYTITHTFDTFGSHSANGLPLAQSNPADLGGVVGRGREIWLELDYKFH